MVGEVHSAKRANRLREQQKAREASQRAEREVLIEQWKNKQKEEQRRLESFIPKVAANRESLKEAQLRKDAEFHEKRDSDVELFLAKQAADEPVEQQRLQEFGQAVEARKRDANEKRKAKEEEERTSRAAGVASWREREKGVKGEDALEALRNKVKAEASKRMEEYRAKLWAQEKKEIDRIAAAYIKAKQVALEKREQARPEVKVHTAESLAEAKRLAKEAVRLLPQRKDELRDAQCKRDAAFKKDLADRKEIFKKEFEKNRAKNAAREEAIGERIMEHLSNERSKLKERQDKQTEERKGLIHQFQDKWKEQQAVWELMKKDKALEIEERIKAADQKRREMEKNQQLRFRTSAASTKKK